MIFEIGTVYRQSFNLDENLYFLPTRIQSNGRFAGIEYTDYYQKNKTRKVSGLYTQGINWIRVADSEVPELLINMVPAESGDSSLTLG